MCVFYRMNEVTEFVELSYTYFFLISWIYALHRARFAINNNLKQGTVIFFEKVVASGF